MSGSPEFTEGDNDLDGFEVISELSDSMPERWALQGMYKKAQTGRQTYWQVGFDGESIVSVFGSVNGKVRSTSNEVVTNKSGRSLQEQAFLEANQKYQMKFRKEGYRPPGEVVDSEDKQPMLATKYADCKSKTFPLIAQAKIDGIRMMAGLDESGEVYLRTGRGNKPVKYLETIREQVGMILSHLPEGSVLDGEVYKESWPINKIASVFKRESVIHPENELLDYFVFDLIEPARLNYTERMGLVYDAWDRIDERSNGGEEIEDKVIPLRYKIVHSEAEVKAAHDEYHAEGFEGAMFRLPDKPYKYGRTNWIMKYKEFQDEEAKIIDVTEGTGTEKGLAMFVVRDVRGNEFNVRPTGTFEQRREWFENQSQVIGKDYTIRFIGLTEYGVPFHCVGKALRDYE